MIYEKIHLKDYYADLPNDVYLECFVLSNYPEYNQDRKRKSVIILPGGGYEMVSEREAEPIATQFLSADVSSFVLRYSVKPHTYPVQIMELFAAVAYVRSHAEKYHLNPDKISVCGFSAGGHLAACGAAFHHKQEYADMLHVNVSDITVNGAILCYPVISMGQYTHEYTKERITHNQENLIELLSIEKQVSEHFPKTFLWHTLEDNCVPYQNSTQLAEALKEKNIYCELHLFEKGGHGLSLANEITAYWIPEQIVPEVQKWVPLCIKFIKEII